MLEAYKYMMVSELNYAMIAWRDTEGGALGQWSSERGVNTSRLIPANIRALE